MPLYTGPLDARLLKVPRPFRMRRDEDGTEHELQEIPGNLSPRDFVGLYRKGDPVLLAYVFSLVVILFPAGIQLSMFTSFHQIILRHGVSE